MQILHSNTAYDHWKQYQEERKKHPEIYRLRSTGIRDLDRLLGGGVEYGQMIIYGGQQKVGKSVMLQHTAQHFGRQRDGFAFFSLEMTNMMMMTRLVCSLTSLDKGKVRRMELDEFDWRKADIAGKEISEYTGSWVFGVNEINAMKKVLLDERKNGNDIWTIFVDHFHLVKLMGHRTRTEELSQLSHEFKQMSLDFGHPLLVFVASQLNRSSIRAHVQDANAFMGTSSLEQDMDVGVIIQDAKDNDKVLPNYKDLVVVGSRDTGTGTCRIRFNGATSQIKAIDDISDNPVVLGYWNQEDDDE